MQTEDQVVPAVEDVSPTSQEQAQQPAEVGSEPGAEQVAQQPDDATQQKPKGDWVQRRIDQLTREKFEERRQREALEAQVRQYQQQQGDQTHQPANKPMAADDIRAEARRLVQQERFDDACNKTFDAGKKDFPDWESSLKTFGMLGGAPQEFLEVVTSLDAGHRVIHHLGSNPEEAERLLSLPPLRMATEVARIEASLRSKAHPVSKAPPPISPVAGRAAPPEPSDFGSTAEYAAWKRANRK
jgi:hypothetical protein